jgi:isopenicillin N synthase-like dioxygenase
MQGDSQVELTEIPFIDITGLYDENLEVLESIAYEIKSTTETSGVFYIKNHGVSREVIKNARFKSHK